jgi:hypothetical protein
MSERFLVIGEPVERALPYNRHHDLDGFGVPNTPAQNVVGMFDGADDEDVPAHDGNVPQRTSQDDANRLAAKASSAGGIGERAKPFTFVGGGEEPIRSTAPSCSSS